MDGSDIGARAQQLAEIIQKTTVTVSSSDALVTVTMAPGGEIRTLRFDPRVARRCRAPALATTVLDLLRDGMDQVERELADRSQDVLPTRAHDAMRDPGTTALPDVTAPDSTDETPDPDIPPQWADRPGVHDAAQAATQWREFATASQRYVEAYQAMQRQIAESELTVTSPQGQVSVVYRGGRLADLHLAPQALHDPHQLAAQVHGTLDEARSQWAAWLAREVQRAVAPMMPSLDLPGMVARHQPETAPEHEQSGRRRGM